MRLDDKYDALVLTMAELAALGRQPGKEETALSLVPVVEATGKDTILTAFARLGRDKQDEYSRAIAMLAAPSQIARLYYTVADETVTRMYLAWRPEDKKSVAVLATTGNDLAVSLRPEDYIENNLSSVLALDSKMIATNLRISLSAASTIVLMAVMDYFQYTRHFSILTHTAPASSFNRQELMKRLEDAGSEDFRWPLLFFDKILPVQVAGRFSEREINTALEELCQAGLLLKNESEDNNPELTLYSLAGGAETISDSILHSVSKAAIGVSSVTGDGETGHEAMMLVRSANYLWLFGVGGKEGIIASIEATKFTEILQKLFTPPEKTTTTAKVSAPRPRPATQPVSASAGSLTCTKCGTNNPTNAQFCTKCGAALAQPVKRFCPKCGDIVKAGEKFCDKCGYQFAY